MNYADCFTNDGKYFVWNCHKIKINNQTESILDRCRIESQNITASYTIEDELINRHFVVLFGLNVCVEDETELISFVQILSGLAVLMDKVDGEFVYLITEYENPDNWTACEVTPEGEVLYQSVGRLKVVNGRRI